MSKVLEYTVDTNGRVHTTGAYRIVDEDTWNNVQPVPLVRRTPYTPVLDAVRAGHIVALPAHSRKQSWNIARTLRLLATRLEVPVEIKRGLDPQAPSGEVVLVRLQRGST